MEDSLKTYASYLERLDISSFRSRAQEFWEKEPISEADAMSRFMDVVSIPRVEAPNESSFAYPTRMLRYSSGQTFWRARALEMDDNVLPLRAMNQVSDAWEAPKEYVRARGRLNEIGESVLYCSIGAPQVAATEARIKFGEPFALIRYATIRPIVLAEIAGLDPHDLPTMLLDAHRVVTGFYRDVFTREFDGVNDLAYRLSNSVAKNWFDLPEAIVDGWHFPSIAHRRGANAAFRPHKAHEVLQVVGIAYSTAVDSALQGMRIRASSFSTGTADVDGQFSWHPLGSDIQRRFFPDFS